MDSSVIMDSNEEIKEKTPDYHYEKKEKKESSGSGKKKKSGSKEKNSPNWAKNPIYKLSQIKKPTRRNNSSSVIWSPRRKTDSYLKRKIKNLQEAGGMNLTLDQTLGSSNLHFTRIAREKIAAKEAAKRALEARKSAMVEASWCRILKAARIKNKSSETELEKSKKLASEAFESARKIGVMMYDRPDSQNRYEIQPRTGQSQTGTTHKITASFETPFEVDKQVSNAVKHAFLKLASEEKFKGLLWKIRENPEEIGTGTCLFGIGTGSGLVGTMVERLKGLKEEELVSLAEIVATCGLNEALLEVESKRLSVDEKLGLGFQEDERETLTQVRKKEVEVPSLDKFLVKRVSKLEREVQEARNQKSGTELGLGFKKKEEEIEIPSLDMFLVKRVSKLEREVQEARRLKSGTESRLESGLGLQDENAETLTLVRKREKEKEAGSEIPSLDKFLVKKVSKLEREVQEARKKSGMELGLGFKKHDETLIGTAPGLESVLKKHMSKLEKKVHEAKHNNNNNNYNNNNLFSEKDFNVMAQLPPRMTRLQKARLETLKGFDETGQMGLDKILVKPVHWLERERNKKEMLEKYETKKICTKENVESLSDVLKSQRVESNEFKSQRVNLDEFEVRKNEIWERKKEERERELMENWGNLSLENSIKPRLSRIERDKIAWKKAEDVEKNRVGAQKW